jgi:hypothetical protein
MIKRTRKATLLPERHKRGPVPAARELTDEKIKIYIDDLVKQRIPLDRINLSDDQVPGLRVIVRNTGAASFHAQYYADGNRPMVKVGEFPAMKLETARRVARTVNALVEIGIDPFKELLEQRVQDLLDKGVKWRP